MGAAAAVIAGQGLPHFLLRGLRVLIEQRFGRHDHAGDTEAALVTAVVQKCLLQAVQLPCGPVRQALDGGDVRPVAVHGQGHAGGHGPAVNNHGTAAAGPLVAADLKPGQLQTVPQGVGQGLALRHIISSGADFNVVLGSIHFQSNDFLNNFFHLVPHSFPKLRQICHSLVQVFTRCYVYGCSSFFTRKLNNTAITEHPRKIYQIRE